MLGPSLPITYPYFRIDRYVNDYTNIGPGISNIYYSNNIQLNSIPRRMYIFMRERNSDLYSNPNRTDTFLSIQNLSIQFNNRSGLLSTASQQQLYQMCVKNHCNMSWEQWTGGPVYSGDSNFVNRFGTVGSVMCVEFGTDIPNQSPIEAPGKSGAYQLLVQINATNVSGRSINASFYIVPVYEGTFTVPSIGQGMSQIGVLSSQNILEASENGYVSYNDAEKVNGGDFFSGLKDFFWQVHNFVKKNKLISKGLSLNPETAPFGLAAELLGYGEGGAMMPRKDLRRRLRR
jgi:hypothetical protein